MKIFIDTAYSNIYIEKETCRVFFTKCFNKAHVVNTLLRLKPGCKIHSKLKWATIEKRFNAC